MRAALGLCRGPPALRAQATGVSWPANPLQCSRTRPSSASASVSLEMLGSSRWQEPAIGRSCNATENPVMHQPSDMRIHKTEHQNPSPLASRTWPSAGAAFAWSTLTSPRRRNTSWLLVQTPGMHTQRPTPTSASDAPNDGDTLRRATRVSRCVWVCDHIWNRGLPTRRWTCPSLGISWESRKTDTYENGDNSRPRGSDCPHDPDERAPEGKGTGKNIKSSSPGRRRKKVCQCEYHHPQPCFNWHKDKSGKFGNNCR